MELYVLLLDDIFILVKCSVFLSLQIFSTVKALIRDPSDFY